MDELENLNSQQETVEDAGVVTDEETETAPEESVSDEDKAPEAASGTKEEQSRKDNKRYAEARRAGMEEGAKRERERINKMLARQGIPNPTAEGKNLDSIDAIEEYGIAYRAAQRDVDPSVIRDEDEVRIWKEQRDAEAEAKAEAEQSEKDLRSFRKQYPDVNLEELAKSKSFERFSKNRIGREPLADIYSDYSDFMSDFEPKAKADKNERNTGDGGGATGVISGDKQKALDEWNRLNPEMAMTAAEFMQR